MAIKFDHGSSDPALVAMQMQNADLKPQRESNVPGLADVNSVNDGNLPMDPIPGLPSVAVASVPYRNLRKQ